MMADEGGKGHKSHRLAIIPDYRLGSQSPNYHSPSPSSSVTLYRRATHMGAGCGMEHDQMECSKLKLRRAAAL